MARPPVYKCHGCVSERNKRNGRLETVPCGYIGKTETFAEGENGLRCPKCGADDGTFPYRLYKCKKCGKVADQDHWFPESGLDLDPIREGFEPDSCENCYEKREGEIRAKRDWPSREYDDELSELEETPAELEEVPVELPAT